MADFPSTAIHDHYGNDVEATLLDQMKVASQIRLAGGVFNDSVLDTNFYTATTQNGATAAVANSTLTITTTTTANSAVGVSSARVGRYIGSSSNFFRGNVRLGDTGAANNRRSWGAFNGTLAATTGFFFCLDGTTFCVGHQPLGGVETLIPNGSFNGRVSSWTVDTNCHTYEIYYSISKVQFVIDGVLIHELVQTNTPLAGEVHFKAAITNTNTGVGSAVFICAMALTISRLGEMFGSPKYLCLSAAGTYTLKTGPGTLHRIAVNNPTNNAISIYDSLVGSGTAIAIINPGASATPFSLPYGSDFQAGLTVVLAGNPNVTFIYD